MAKSIRDRNVWGPSGEAGYILKPAGQGRISESKMDECIQIGLEDAQRQRELDQMRHDVCVKDFWVTSDKRCLNSRIERFVDVGMKAYELDLEHKKNKLKVMMLDEQSQFAQEYIDKAQKSNDMIFQSKVKRAEEIKNKAADAEKSFVKKAYDRIFQENCDELRTKTACENRRALMEIHQKQICDRKIADKLAREEDKIWVAFEKENELLRLQRSQKEASANSENSKTYAALLDQQMKDLRHKKYNEKCVEQIEESERQEYQRIKDQELLSRKSEANLLRNINAKELFEQLEANRMFRERCKEDEKFYDRILIEQDRKAAEKEKSAFVDNRAQMRCELQIFRESLKQYNDSLAAHEKDMEVISGEFKKQHELKQLAVKQKSAKAKRDLLNSCIEVRKQQVTNQKEVKQKIKDTNTKEAEYIKFRIAQNDALDVVKREMELQERQEESRVLQECEKYEVVKRGRERLEVAEFTNERQKKFEELDMKTNELLSRPLRTLGSGVHPFLGRLLASKESPSGRT